MSIFPVRFDRIRPFLVLVICVSTNLWGAIDSREDMERVFDSFYRIGLNTETIYAADGFELRKDAMVFQFQEGNFFLMDPLEGEITGAYFIGKGRAKMTAPTAMERKQLARFAGPGPLDMEFTEMAIRFSDGTGSAIQALPTGEIGELGISLEKIRNQFAQHMSFLHGWQQLALEMQYLESRISGLQDRDFFLAKIKTEKYRNVGFRFDQQANQEIFLGHFDKIGNQLRVYTWCRFHQMSDYDDQGRYIADLLRDRKEILDVSHYDMKIHILNLNALDLQAKITLSPQVANLRGIQMELLNTLDFSSWRSKQLPIEVLEVTDVEGNPLPYMHRRHKLLVLLPEPIPAGEAFTFNVSIHEETIQQATVESFSLLNTYPWYPWYGYLGGRFTFNWEVKVPKPYKAVGSGMLVKEWEEKKTNCALWKSETPVHLPSLLFGRFQRETGTYENPQTGNRVRINVHAFPIMRIPGFDEIKVPGAKMTAMLEEAKNILTLFEDIYGPFPYRELDIAQMAPGFGFGQAPPGLVQLTGEAFMSTARTESDFIHGFLSHEIAHQWWANQIGWNSDEETWLSESFAEYSSGIFVQQLQGKKRFQQQLRDWRQRAKIADGVAPIAAAYRTSGDTAGRDRTYLLYNKGPLVLHMLRSQIGDENYKKAMTAVMERYRNQNITTEYIEAEIERVVGYKMDWFFDQWFRDTGIPEIHVKYEVTPASGGGYILEGTVSQDPATFKKFFSLPLRIYFSKGRVANQVVRIGQPQQEFKFKLPENPKKVTVDEDNDLLAEIIIDK